MAKQCLHAVISGHVQGVFFRRHTAKRAKELKLTGWVKNLANGQVELVACGEESGLLQFREWLAIGPSAARVDSVAFDDQEWQEFADFKVVK